MSDPEVPIAQQIFELMRQRPTWVEEGARDLERADMEDHMARLRGESRTKHLQRLDLEDHMARTLRGNEKAQELWGKFQRDVRSDMTPNVVRGFERMLLAFWKLEHEARLSFQDLMHEVDSLGARHTEEIQNLGDAVHTLLRAYEGAIARDDLNFMEDAAWEADSALTQYTGRSVLGMAPVDADSADGRRDVASPETSDGPA